MERTLVIAECGMCHDGDNARAVRLIDAAARAGANAAKFQFWSSSERLATRRHRPERAELYERYRVPESWLAHLKAWCERAGIELVLSSYLPEDVWRVAEYAETLKIASPEANDKEHLVAHVAPANAGRSVLISMGLGADHRMVDDWLMRGINDGIRQVSGRVRLLHCVSCYPAPVTQLALHKLRCDWQTGERYHGLSDHAPPDITMTGAIAVAAGATVVERHLRLDDTSAENPDFAVAMTPAEFTSYVRLIRFAEEALGEPTYSPDGSHQPCEADRLACRVGVGI